MRVKSIAECSKGEHSAILLTFIKLSFSGKTFILSILSGRLRLVLMYWEHFNFSLYQTIRNILTPLCAYPKILIKSIFTEYLPLDKHIIWA